MRAHQNHALSIPSSSASVPQYYCLLLPPIPSLHYLPDLPLFSACPEKLQPSSKLNKMASLSPALLSGKKVKVVFVMGATGTGKSKLAIHLALNFSGEVVNSDKMQVFKGLDVLTNKVTQEERQLVPHHLIDIVSPDAEFTTDDFCRAATAAIDDIASHGKLPVVAGGSNSYIEALVDDPAWEFRSKYESCFLWLDVDMDVLHSFVTDRIDKMVEGGLVEEVRAMHHPEAVYTAGIRQSISVQELDEYLSETITTTIGKEEVLALAIHKMKTRTCDLTFSQLEKIHRLRRKPGWDIHRLDATVALQAAGEEKATAWLSSVTQPASTIVMRFLAGGEQDNEGLHGEDATV